MRKTIAMPIIPAKRISFHKIKPAIIVIIGDVHSGCITTDIISNRFTSFDSKFTSLPGAVSLRALCDN